jgi:diketogulonate reductase-like aldo/keto reductase
MRQHSIPLMAYSPLDQGRLPGTAPLRRIAGEVGCTPAQLAIAWLLAQPGVVAIPKSSTRERVKENFDALTVTLSPDALAALDRAFPPPRRKQSLEML